MTTSVSSDYLEEFIELARSGAPEAGAYLVSLCGARLSNYVNLLDPDLSTADRDVICERAIERAVRNIGSFDATRSSFDTWIRGFARFISREYRRQHPVSATDPVVLTQASDHAIAATGDVSVGDAESNERSQLVLGALRNLSETDQLMIRLRDFEQLSYESIAALLKVQTAACRQRHLRALTRLRNNLVGNPTFDAFSNEG